MNEHAPAIFVALEGSALGAAIRQSPWAYMAANVGHILALTVFAGAIAVMDLRMAGAMPGLAPGAVLRGGRIAAALAFGGLVLTGAVLFTAEASHVVLNPVFQFKMGLVALGLFNVLAFEWLVKPKVIALPPFTLLPAGARFSGMLSLAVWFAVAACGRSIAYF